MNRKTIKQQRKDMLKKYEGKLEGPYDHLKEGVDYSDDEMPKMKGGNSKRGKKEPKTEWEKVKNFIGYGKIVSIIERS